MVARGQRPYVRQTFEGGEADPQFERRSDAEGWERTAKRLRNVRIRNGGSARRRPGTVFAHLITSGAAVRGLSVRLIAGEFSLVFLDSGAVWVLDDDGDVEDVVTGGPWNATSARELQISGGEYEVVIVHQNFAPRVLTRADDGSWALSTLAFDLLGTQSLQPYYRFSARSVSLTPDDTTGSITLTASAALFTEAHEGVRFRLHDREIEVDTYVSATEVEATVLQTLYPTYALAVASTAGFDVDDIVEFSEIQTTATVVEITSGTVMGVLLRENYTPPTTSDTVIGPNANTTISAVTLAATPAAVLEWDEALISPARGYPGVVSRHRNRLLLADFPQAPSLFCASRSGFYFDFDVGNASDADAILAALGDEPSARIRHFVTTEQLIVLTTVGSYYVGEGPQTPLTPTTVDFLAIGEERAGSVPPVFLPEGVAYVESIANRIVVLRPTGNDRRSWDTDEIGDIAPHINPSPIDMSLADGSTLGPERYIFLPQSDGTLAVAHYRRGADIAGWAVWSTEGAFLSVWTHGARIYCIAEREDGGGDKTFIEYFSDLVATDQTVYMSNPSTFETPFESLTGVHLMLYVTGSRLAALTGIYTTDEDGVMTGAPSTSDLWYAGRTFEVNVQLWPPMDPQIGFGMPVEIGETFVNVMETGLFYAGVSRVSYTTLSPTVAGVDVTRPQWFTGSKSIDNLSIGPDPFFEIWQIEPAPFELRAITYWVG